jgi:protein-S-isoprenylcysteine O-methyltransferase Ste14
LLLFWAVFVWAMVPESPIVRKGLKAARGAGSPDAGSVSVIMFGGGLASLAGFALAWVQSMRFSAPWQLPAYLIGVGVIISASLLRRHCFRQLGVSFTGDVRATPDQRVVTTGAYAFVRHPSYTAGILLNVGLGLALGSWGSAALLAIAAFAIYSYRIHVEERVLLAAIGEPYREFMRTRRRLIPYVY